MSSAAAEIRFEISPAFRERLRFIRPTLPPMESVLAHYGPAYASGIITNGAAVERLEHAVAERLGVAHCVAVASCTSGLMLTLRALDLAGEVIMPSLTFFATAHAAVWNGLRPVFADCDPHTWTLDPADVARRITRRTAAIVGVHLYGNPCDIDALERMAARHGLPLIFDAAHGFGSLYGGRAVGGFGTAEVFSLTPTKLLVAGEGGLVTTNDAVLAQRVRAARNYGDQGGYDPQVLGLSARMPEFNAALGLAGLDLVDRKVARHNRIAARYRALLSGARGLRFQKVCAGNRSSSKDCTVLVDARAAGVTRDTLAAALLAANIETRKYFYPPVHRQKLYRRYYDARRGRLPCTDFVSGGVLSLPIYESLADESVERVAREVRRYIP
jgi:dTDP-4-amino-4,6-dideoxygalactose transaminase